jgi:ATP-dependent Clp protease ATP-binding subunit ClpC
MLANRELQLIATGSMAAFRRTVRGDPRLAGVLQDIMIAPPTPAVAIEMLKGSRDRYEAHHRISITDDALVEAVRLGDRYFHDRHLPAAAIDLLDEAGAELRIRRMIAPPELRDLDERIAQVRRDRESAIDAQDFERARELRDKEKQLLGQKAQREKEWKAGDLHVVSEVDGERIRSLVEQMLKERIDEESAAPTVPDHSQPTSHSNVFPDTDDVWAMS